jgi:hypothetical protein
MEPGQLSGIALGYELDDRGFESRQELGISSSPPRSDRLWALPTFYPMDTIGSFPERKAAGSLS